MILFSLQILFSHIMLFVFNWASDFMKVFIFVINALNVIATKIPIGKI